jgi:elongation factor G
MYKWNPGDTAPAVLDIPSEEKEKAEELYRQLLEAAAENDETLMEKYFDQGTLSEEEMRDGIQKGLISRSIFPVFCASSAKNMAVHRLMNFLSMVAPSPDQMPAPVDSAATK